MARNWASASALERIAECPASAALPPTGNVSKAASKGHDDHAAIEEALVKGQDSVLTSGGVIQVEELRVPADSRPEVCFSWDAVTGEAKCHGKLSEARGYPEAPYSTLFGTADNVGIISVEVGEVVVQAVLISDWKTGHPSFLPDADSWQMRALAMMAAKSMGVRYAITRIVGVREGFVNHKPQRLWLAEELDETEVKLRKIYDAVNRAGRKGVTISDVRHGSHCTFCPALASCPYAQSILTGGRLSQLDTRDLAQAYNNWQAVKAVGGRMEEMMKAAATEAPVDLGGGYFYGQGKNGFRRFRKTGGDE